MEVRGTQALLSICPPRHVKYVEYSSQFGHITGIATLLTSTTDLTGQEKRLRPTRALETFQIRRAILTHRLIQTLHVTKTEARSTSLKVYHNVLFILETFST